MFNPEPTTSSSELYKLLWDTIDQVFDWYFAPDRLAFIDNIQSNTLEELLDAA